jgi:ABC-type multidrug transport system ATPase subunit
VLKLTRVVKSFGGRRILDQLDLDVAAGESVALLGANGSGKTTALRCIVGLARPDGGRIEVGGVDVSRDPIGARRRLSYLPQQSTFPSTLTIRETLAAVARLRGLAGADVDREIGLCRLEALADRGVARLSGGERQRLAMAVAFLPAVDLYLLDEPSASLDPTATEVLFRRVARLKIEGRTLLFTTHVRSDVQHLATRVAFLHEGRIESSVAGSPDPRGDVRIFERCFWGGNDEDVYHGDRRSDRVLVDCGLRDAGAIAGAGGGRPRRVRALPDADFDRDRKRADRPGARRDAVL